MGLLDALTGNGDPVRSQAMDQFIGGLLGGNMRSGLLGASKVFAEGPMRQLQMEEARMKMDDERKRREFLANLPDPTMQASMNALSGGGGPTLDNAARMQPVSPIQQLMYQGAKSGAVGLKDYLATMQPKTLEFGKVDPKDYTPESLRAAATTGDYTKLVPVRKLDVVGNKAVNLYDTAPGTVMDLADPNKPFGIVGGKVTPNLPLQQYETTKARAGATNVSVNTEKSLLNEVAGGVGKSVTEARGGASAALNTIGTVGRLFDALDSKNMMAGPGTTFRQFGLQVGNMLGVAGRDAQEKLLNTRLAIQSLAQLELDAAQQMKGQGQITEAERALIKRAASGDIDGMTTSELRVVGNVIDRTARAKIRNYNNQVKPFASNPNAASIAPFLTVEEPPERSAPNVLRFDAQGNPVR